MNSVIEPRVKCAAGLDVHQGRVICTVLEEQGAGAPRRATRQYDTFPRRLKELGRWLQERGVELAVLESTGIYWKNVYAALEGDLSDRHRFLLQRITHHIRW